VAVVTDQKDPPWYDYLGAAERAEVRRLVAEIERLTAENQLAWNKADELDARARRAEADNKRLRAALTAILDDPEIGVNVTLIARAALEPKP
jgi:hypothetical protein